LNSTPASRSAQQFCGNDNCIKTEEAMMNRKTQAERPAVEESRGEAGAPVMGSGERV